MTEAILFQERAANIRHGYSRHGRANWVRGLRTARKSVPVEREQRALKVPGVQVKRPCRRGPNQLLNNFSHLASLLLFPNRF